MMPLKRPIAHVGYSVQSIEKAVDLWSAAFGAGPFFRLENIVFDELEHAGAPAVFEHSTAFGQCGDFAVELWEVTALEPVESLGRRFAPTDQINHISYCVDDLDAEGERLEALGIPLLMSGRMGSVQLRLHDAPQLGHLIEIEPQTELMTTFQRGVAKASDDWDGTRPIRDVREILPDL